jgi:low affinity Fe/Cu permease
MQRPNSMEALTRDDNSTASWRRLITSFAVYLTSPWAFAVVGLYSILWFIFERETFDWHAVATLATWFMTLFIQRAAHRDMQAVHAKLDELLHAQHLASNALTRLDEAEPEDIEQHRKEARMND